MNDHSRENLGNIWISLAEVEALNENKHFARGEKSFVYVLVSASSEADVEGIIKQAFLDEAFSVVSLEDTELWSDYVARSSPRAYMFALAESAEKTGLPQFDTFHTWDNQG